MEPSIGMCRGLDPALRFSLPLPHGVLSLVGLLRGLRYVEWVYNSGTSSTCSKCQCCKALHVLQVYLQECPILVSHRAVRHLRSWWRQISHSGKGIWECCTDWSPATNFLSLGGPRMSYFPVILGLPVSKAHSCPLCMCLGAQPGYSHQSRGHRGKAMYLLCM